LPGAPGRPHLASWLGDLVRAAAGPVACAIVLIGLLSAWVASGGAGTIAPVRIQVSQAAVPMRGYPSATVAPSGPAGTFLTIRNPTSQPDELIAVHSPVARHIVLRRSSGPQDLGTVVSALTIPAKSSITLTPFGDDVVLRDPVRYESDSSVSLTLTFRHAGTITVSADVTAPGTP
jgi:copper(I)-binding protein